MERMRNNAGNGAPEKRAVDPHKFTNCLRVQIVPDDTEGERIADVISFCRDFGFSNVMLFFNAEEFNLGHITREEARPWIQTIKRAKRALEGAGISVGLNPWMEIGHLDRGRKRKAGQAFIAMTDAHGNRAEMVACPRSEAWQQYYLDLMAWYVRETDPDILWIEDDFRLHNHAPLDYGGCFCEEHMRRYCARLGREYTRELLVSRIFCKGAPTPERTAWLDESRDTMLDLAAKIGETVQRLGLGTRVGLMSSMPQAHCAEGRDWRALKERLRAGKESIDRIHLPCYEERCAKEYLYYFNACSMIVRTFLPADTLVYPELENGSFSTFTKDARFLRFQLESALPLLMRGMTYDIFDFAGNGTIRSFSYGEAVRSVTPYLQGMLDMGLDFRDLHGVVLPVDARVCYVAEGAERPQGYTARPEMAAYGLLGGLGANGKPSEGKRFEGETVLLTEISFFTDGQLEDLFAGNFVIADGGCALALARRGLSHLIGADGAELFAVGSGPAYEQAADGVVVEDKRKYRAGCQEKAGAYVRVHYTEPVSVRSETFRPDGTYFGPGFVRGKNFAVLPFVVEGAGILYEQFNPLRRANLFSLLREVQRDYVQSAMCGVFVYTYKKGKDDVVVLVNATVETFPHTVFFTGMPFSELLALGADGALSAVRFAREGDRVEVHRAFDYLSTQVYLLKR